MEQEQKIHTLPHCGDASTTIYPVTEGVRSSLTRDKYRRDFNHFLDFIQIHDLQVLIDLGPKVIQEMIIKYIFELRDKQALKRATINGRCTAILHFLDMNDIQVNKSKIKRHLPYDESIRDDRPYSIEEIAKIIAICDQRNKAMVLLMRSSGIRIGAISGMQIGDLIPVTYQGQELYKIRVYARTHDEYYSFCTPECRARAIDPYLDYRKRLGEDLKGSSPLFRKEFKKNDPFTINSPKFLCNIFPQQIIDKVLNDSGVKTPEAMRSHAWRKGFKSICEQSGMKSINVEILLGHDIGVSGHYYRPVESDILEDYMTHGADALTIDPTQRLKQENEKLRKNQKDYLAELGELKEDFDEMKQLLVHLNKDSQKEIIDELSQKVEDKAEIEWSCDD